LKLFYSDVLVQFERGAGLKDCKNSLLRKIPKVDEVLAHPGLAQLDQGAILTNAVRHVLGDLRRKIQQGELDALPCRDTIVQEVAAQYRQYQRLSLRRVINGTGVILHTNFGRAPLAQEALDAMVDVARDYSNLEYNIFEGIRGSRHSHVEDLLTQLTGAEAAMVVNNNAAAILLALSAVAHHKDVIVSRGELVEIGGSFRVPDVLAQSGCRLVEVGTTNKTHALDYEKAILAGEVSNDYAISPGGRHSFTGALLRVHTSNFIMSGFVAKPALAELSAIAGKHGIPLIEDLGSGCMIPLSQYGIHGQPVVADSVKAGVDIVTFSGDKLLGGPQAGIVVGRKEHIAKMKAHPLARAMRIDKLCLAALEATLRLYLDPEMAVEKIPTLRMLCERPEALYEKARLLVGAIDKAWADIANSMRSSHAITEYTGRLEIITEASQVGGGAMPEENISTAAVSIVPKTSAQALERALRMGPVPIIGRISQGRFILDVRTLDAEDFPYIAEKLVEAEKSIVFRF